MWSLYKEEASTKAGQQEGVCMKVQPQRGAILTGKAIKHPANESASQEEILAALDNLRRVVLRATGQWVENGNGTSELVGRQANQHPASEWVLNMPSSVSQILSFQPEAQNDILAPVFDAAVEFSRGRGKTRTFRMNDDQRVAMLAALQATNARMGHRDLRRAIEELKTS